MFLGTLDPASTRADWELVVAFTDADTGEPLDLTGAAVLVEARDRLSGGVVLSASSGNGKVSVPDAGTIRIAVAAADMRALRADVYDIGGVLVLNGVTRQFVIGLLPVLDGVVT